ncbi:hypothetical protein AKJ16_DCAP27108 [Drosera capensis]
MKSGEARDDGRRLKKANSNSTRSIILKTLCWRWERVPAIPAYPSDIPSDKVFLMFDLYYPDLYPDFNNMFIFTLKRIALPNLPVDMFAQMLGLTCLIEPFVPSETPSRIANLLSLAATSKLSAEDKTLLGSGKVKMFQEFTRFAFTWENFLKDPKPYNTTCPVCLLDDEDWVLKEKNQIYEDYAESFSILKPNIRAAMSTNPESHFRISYKVL